MTDLKPCPFCGSTRILGMTLQCPKCSAIGPRATSQPEAVELWNRRASAWIPVAERLPLERSVVLIWPSDSEHPAAKFESGVFRICCCLQIAGDVTHWRSLPAPPDGAPIAKADPIPGDWKRRGIL